MAWLGGWRSRVGAGVRRNPTLFFGMPFMLTMVLGSFGLAQLTQTRYTHHDKRVRAVTQEESLKLRTDRKRVDIREEYYRLQGKDDGLDDWEPKRVARPAGMPEWGGVPDAAPAGREAVAADTAPASASSFFTRRAVQAEERAGEEERVLPPRPARKPAVVLGPDGKPCKACTARTSFGAAMRAQTKHTHDPCPPDINELGHSTWTFLHAAAAHYPREPAAVQQSSMRAMLDALPHIYPCAHCAAELADEYARQDAEARTHAVQSAARLQTYLCELHNEVNARLGKPVWDCSDTKRLRYRWEEAPEERGC